MSSKQNKEEQLNHYESSELYARLRTPMSHKPCDIVPPVFVCVRLTIRKEK